MKSSEFSYEVSTSTRRKTLSIVVHSDNRVIVHAPAGCPRVRIALFVEQKSEWIKKVLQVNSERCPRFRERVFETGERLPFLGREYTLHVEEAKAAAVGLEEGLIRVRLGPRDLRAGPSRIKELLLEWYVSRAMAKIGEKIALYAPRINVSPGRVTIKSLKSRWGSCSTTGRISLAWNIVMAPEAVLDYLVVHELCHLVHHDHSTRYWSLVGSILPDHRERRKWLRENGWGLYL